MPTRGLDVRRRDPFFLCMSIVLLLTVLIGFLPTLYLRTLRGLPPLPGHLLVHGAILTGWFVWLVVQASLIEANRVAHHRRLGVLGAVLGLAVVLAGPLATLNLVPRIRAAGLDLDMDISALDIRGLGSDMSIARFLSGTVIWPNIAGVATFAVLHDVISTKRVHRATLLGAAFAVSMTFGGLAIGASRFGEAFVREM